MWDELLQYMTFGKKVIYKDEEFIVIHALENDFYLAVKSNDEMPAQTYLIQVKLN